MKLEIRNVPHPICLVGVNDIWQVDTEDSYVTEDEDGEAEQGQSRSYDGAATQLSS